MRWLLSLLLLMPFTGRAVEWLYIGSSIAPNGCLLKLKLSTSPDLGSAVAVTNLAFFNGLGTNNSITHTTALTATITGMGFNPLTGATQLVQRIAYGTILERLPDPLENTNNIIAESVTNVTLGVWLSEYVYSNDTVSVTALAGAVANTNVPGSFTNSAAFTATATNGSVIPYDAAKCITRWTEAPYRIITNNIFYAKLKAFHRHGIASVQCIARDENSNWFTNRQTAPQIDRSGIEAIPTAKWIFPMDMSSFSNGNEIRFDFRAEPLVGTEATVQSTLDGVNIRGPNYAPQYYRLDRLNNWGVAWCHVDPTNGTTAGVVSSNATFSGIAAFDTIGHALDACALSNAIWFGTTRSNTANSRIFLAPGKYDWLGGADTLKGNPFPNPAPLITSHPTNATRVMAWLHKSSVASFSEDKSRRIHLWNVLVGFTNLFGFVNGTIDHLFLDRCTIDSTPQIFNAITNSYTIGCVISNMPSGFTGANHSPTVIGGNWFYNTNECQGRTFCQYGNQRMVNMGNTALANPLITTTWAAVQGPAPDRAICEGNAFVGLNVSGAIAAQFYDEAGCTNGGYFGNNILENTNRGVATSLLTVSAQTPGTNSTNIIFEGNVVVGGRILFAYNDSGDAPWYKVLFSFRNNLIDDFNCKSDTFGTGNSSRTGNWPCVFGVGMIGNLSPDSGFPTEFKGLNSYLQDLSTPTNWFQFETFGAAVVGSVSGTGLGGYRLLSHSQVFKIATYLPNYAPQPAWGYGIDGHTDSAIQPAGAYRAGQRKKGAFF